MKNIRGFTLIELLVVITIMLVITGGGIAAFINFNERQAVTTSVREIQTLMRAAQIKARAGEGASDCTRADDNLRGYEVVYEELTRTVIMNRVCFSPTVSPSELETERTRITLSNVTVTPPDFEVEFLALKGGVRIGNSAPAPTTLDIVVGSTLNGGSYTFTIGAGGEITEGNYN